LLYEGVGSGEGIQRLLLGQVDLAGSDVPLDRKQLQQVKFKILQVPIALVAFVPIYHIAEVSERDILRFTPEVLASIGRGAITMWNDPAIEAINPAVKLPAEAITIVHRSDPSGTTYIVSQFLSYYSRDWRDVGLTISWPEGSKEGAGNAGVARIVAEVPGALGFVEYIYALKNNLKYGYVRNRAGRFIRPNVESLSAAVPPTATLSSDPTKLIEQILKSDNESAYPITSVTWLLVAARKSSDGRRQVVGQFLPWMLTSGQNFCEGLRYGRLPKDLVESELKEIRQLP
jgi:phosphate transport system substrate-binding protein